MRIQLYKGERVTVMQERSVTGPTTPCQGGWGRWVSVVRGFDGWVSWGLACGGGQQLVQRARTASGSNEPPPCWN